MAVRTLRYNTFEGGTWKGATFATDRDALAFLEAAQIYNRNQQKAIVDLVRRLKTAGLWSKMKAIYPFIGGTATSHKFNLKDPRDTDAAFRLTFSGGWTHSANGALPNGTNGYADTFLTPSSSLGSNSKHLSYYSRTNSTVTTGYTTAIGCDAGSNYCRLTIKNNFAGEVNNCYSLMGGTNGYTNATNTNTTGFYTANRQSSTVNQLYRNAANIGTASVNLGVSSDVASAATIAAARTNSTIAYYENRECAFATIGDGLTDTDATNLYNIVDLYQKRLGRAV